MSKCTRYEDMISAYVDGELSAAEEAELTAHLEVCPSCRDLLAVYRNLQELVTENAVEPPAELLSNVMAGISGLNITKSSPIKRFRRVSVRYLAVAACIAVAVMAVPQILGGSRFSAPTYTADAEVYASSSQMETGAVSDETEVDGETFAVSSAAGSLPESQEKFTAGADAASADAASADNAESAAVASTPAAADSSAALAESAPAAGSGTSDTKNASAGSVRTSAPASSAAAAQTVPVNSISSSIGTSDASSDTGSISNCASLSDYQDPQPDDVLFADNGYAGTITITGSLPKVLRSAELYVNGNGIYRIYVSKNIALDLVRIGYDFTLNESPLSTEFVVIYTPAV